MKSKKTLILLLLAFVPILSSLLSSLLTGCALLIFKLAECAVYFKEGLVSTENPFVPVLLFLLLVPLALLLFTHKKRLSILLFAGCYLLFGSVCFLYPRFERPQLILENDGRNDTLVFYDGGKSLLIDLSNGSKGHFDRALHLLKEKTGDQTPDGLLLTHYHQAHLSSLSDLFKEYHLKTLYLTAPLTEGESALCRALEDLAREHGVSVRTLSKEEGIDCGRYRIENLERSYLDRSTHPVLAFTVDTGCHRFSYLSSSLLEGTFYLEEEILLFGVHGPTVKQELHEYYIENRTLLFVDPSLAESYGVTDGVTPSQTSNGCLFEDCN